MKIITNIIGALFFSIVLLSGCKVGPDMKPPEVLMPDAYRFEYNDNDSIPDLTYWKVFKDPVLLRYINNAIDNNQDLGIAMNRIEESRLALGISKTLQLPSIKFLGQAGYGTISPNNTIIPSENDQYVLAPQLSWELDIWGKYRRNKESAVASFTQTNYGYRAVMLSLVTQVANTYFTILDYKNRYKIALSTYKSREESYSIIKDRFDRGYTALLDVNQAEIQMNFAYTQMIRYQRLIGNSEISLSILMGEMPHKIETESTLYERELPFYVPVGMPSDLLLRRPDILKDYYNIVRLNADVGVAVAQRFPSLSLTATGGLVNDDATNFFTSNSLQWSVYGILAGPIFNFGRNKKRVEIARTKVKAAVLQYERTVIRSVGEIDNTLLEIDTYRKEIEATQSMLAAAGSAYTLSKARYAQGVVSYLEVLDSEKTYFRVQMNLSRLYRQRIISFVKLYKGLGGGWIEMEISK
ncbi:TolC family protein [Halosquirtibacter laminarini]|uniref:TolC family protein n=1 Tax=Halosquirtibacter laminarini TaxID=3374600 RepID=A0AC61NKX4_9BACT|nr:TolC family protein [Prolixibacteraceae bacterium]